MEFIAVFVIPVIAGIISTVVGGLLLFRIQNKMKKSEKQAKVSKQNTHRKKEKPINHVGVFEIFMIILINIAFILGIFIPGAFFDSLWSGCILGVVVIFIDIGLWAYLFD